MPMPSHRPSAPAILIVAAIVLGLGAWVLAAPADFAAMKREVRDRFPEVSQLSTAELSAWLADPKRPQPVLLDARTEKEFAVSHLHGARRVEPAAKANALLRELPPGRPVVVYCSVGYRSSAVAERLQKSGVKNVFNLEGSIFQWANEGRALEADGHPADKVHPYNGRYGKWLAPERRAEP